MQEQLDLINQVYEIVINFAVNYSFQLFGALLVLIAGFIVGGWVSRIILRAQERRNVDVTLRHFIASTVRILVVGMFLIIALSQMGISITPLIAAIGGLAVGASFAVQGPISNYGAGLIIILTRMYKVGDTISVQGCAGLVEEISLATTILEAEDGEKIIIPNKHIVGEIHRNSMENRVVEGQIGIAYSSDPDRAIEVIRSAVIKTDGISEMPPQIGIHSFGDSAINIDYRVWVRTDAYHTTMHALNLAVFKALGDAGIAIPFPQREVRVLSDH
ncbi:MAG: mechanosensitive ion channel family protein [Pseudomonadota bacterium]